jgi:TetR/AcrR family transcriptional regulator, regulator of autoinduction and epiphytic fitness
MNDGDQAGASITPVETVDGRELRSIRTRSAIVEAWLELIEETDAAPSARAVAERAGIGLRTVFQHFDDVETLHLTAAARHMERIAPFLQPVAAVGSLDERIDSLVLSRSKLFERIASVRRAALRMEPTAPAVATVVRSVDESLRKAVIDLFRDELIGLTRNERGYRTNAIDVATSWSAWDHLRNRRALPAAACRHTMRTQLHAVLNS